MHFLLLETLIITANFLPKKPKSKFSKLTIHKDTFNAYT